ncbi:MAG: hypothetical protein B6D35_06240 [Candidatus Brocadia sp. UTAMX2]|nr:MAG: hypothetical protein B6D35_06240 [Candidatus Brocadia sp. UTAMX2]
MKKSKRRQEILYGSFCSGTGLMVKYAALVLCLVVICFSPAYGDTIVLKNSSADIDLKITSVRKDCVNAILTRHSIKSLNMEFFSSKEYPDVIVLNITNTAMECKIKEIAEDYVRLQIPASVISSLAVSSPLEGDMKNTVSDKMVNRLRMGDVEGRGAAKEPEEGRVFEPMADGNAREGGIRDGLRTSSSEGVAVEKNYRLRVKKAERKSPSVEGELSKPETESSGLEEALTDEETLEPDAETSEMNQQAAHEPMEPLEEEDKEGVEDVVKKDKPVDQDPNLGRVEGRILHSGKPLPDCQVKLQMLEKVGILNKGYHPIEGALEHEVITDKDGVYRFMNMSPGLYKVYWKPSSETSWIRRFKMEPDVVVNSGRLTTPKDIETLKRTLN